MRPLHFIALFLLVSVLVLSVKDHQKHHRKIVLQETVIDTTAHPSSLKKPAKEEELRQYYIQLEPPISNEIKSLLKKKVNSRTKALYVPHNTFVVVCSQKDAQKLLELQNQPQSDSEIAQKEKDPLNVVWVNEVEASHKLSEKLRRFMADPSIKTLKPKIELNIEILPIKGSTSEKLAQELNQQIKSVFPILTEKQSFLSINFQAVSKNKIVVELNMKTRKAARTENFVKFISWLSEHFAVINIQFKEKFGTLDGEKIMSQMNEPLMKEGSYEKLILDEVLPNLQEMKPNSCIGQRNMPDVQYLWGKGLNGSNEIIAIADTGIDYTHCMFYDPKYPKPPFNKVSKDTHRKIVAYWTHADDKDAVNGHGSHISGIAVGKCHKAPQFDGVIPEAKVAFMDIGTEGGFLAVPWNLEKGYFDKFYEAGARISSNSWGNARLGQYTQAAREIDHFTFKHKDFLPLFAAGNGGRSGSNTLTPPGTAKNCLTTGSSQATYDAYKLAYPLYANLLKEQFQEKFCGKDSVNPMVDSVCPSLKLASLKNCCNSPMLKKFCCLKTIYENMMTNPQRFNEKNMATFSSRGPTKDGRIKPDLVVTGQPIFSARSDGATDDYDHMTIPLVMQGTSQSTPIMAGYAMMIRQYFMKGFYPSGEPNAKDSFEPTAALLKAVLVNSAEELDGMVEWDGDGDWRKLEKSPNPVQGFGKAKPTNTLIFKGDSKHQFFKAEGEIKTGKEASYCFKLDKTTQQSDPSKKLFKATLTWMDYPAHPNAKIALVNDLDLEVQIEKKVYYGNGGSKKDFLNTIEQVSINENEIEADKVIKVVVKGANVPHGPQSFAVVATGHFIQAAC